MGGVQLGRAERGQESGKHKRRGKAVSVLWMELLAAEVVARERCTDS